MHQNFNILVTDDEESQREALAGFLKKKNFFVHTASSHAEAVDILKSQNIDLVLTDFKMPEKTGADLLIDAKKINPLLNVVLMTAHATIDSAVDIMRNGAFDYMQKPLDLQKLLFIIERAQERNYLISENNMLKRQLSEKFSFGSIVYQSEEMEKVLSTASRVAPSKASVLIRGESGTGKELIARAIHFAGDRKDKPFVVVNCAALPETLFESELFGHEKGAFTGANNQRIGKFELADKGTLFIDEVGDIPLPVQVKLLRAVQFGQIERLGGNKTIDLDVRILTATNRNLEQMIESNEFREDLYYRFNVVTINLPPLRDRKEDIPLLTDKFIRKFASENSKDVKGITKEALDKIMKYRFPGNIRELENLMQRAVVLTRDEYISTNDLPLADSIQHSGSVDNAVFDKIEAANLNKNVESLEITLINKALKKTAGNQVKAAEILDVSERTLRYKISKYGIKN